MIQCHLSMNTTTRIILVTLVFLILAIVGWGPRIWYVLEGKKYLKEIERTNQEIRENDAKFREEMAKLRKRMVSPING